MKATAQQQSTAINEPTQVQKDIKMLLECTQTAAQ
jgi:hypothetical protein